LPLGVSSREALQFLDDHILRRSASLLSIEVNSFLWPLNLAWSISVPENRIVDCKTSGKQKCMCSILLVEDDVVNQKLAFQVLGKWGIHVAIAHDGMEALDMLKETKYQLIIMDIYMPVMDGIETTAGIRSSSDPHLRSIPILAYTASDIANSLEKANKLGMDDFIMKPLSAPELHVKINKYLPKAHQTAPGQININFHGMVEHDPVFQQELMVLMVQNLRELQLASYRAYYATDKNILLSAIHKIKSTITMLNDKILLHALEELKDTFLTGGKLTDRQSKISSLNMVTENIIRSIESMLRFQSSAVDN
jgi:CheY-like chemotaxis protein